MSYTTVGQPRPNLSAECLGLPDEGLTPFPVSRSPSGNRDGQRWARPIAFWKGPVPL